MVVVTAVSPSRALPQDRRPDRDDQQPGDERQPGVELLREDELREPERNEPEGEDPGRVGDRDRAAEQHCVPRSSSRAHEVRRHDGLSVTGCECVGRAPEHRDDEGQRERTEREVASLDQRLETAGTWLGWSRRVEGRRHAMGRTGPDDARRRRDSGRRAEQVLRVRAQSVALARRGHVGLEDARTVARRERDLAPADPPGERAILEPEDATARTGLVHDVDAQRLEPAGSGRRHDASFDRTQRDAVAVERQIEIASEPCREPRSADRVTELVGRDLRDVQGIAHVHRVPGDLDARVPVDREVAERMGVGERRRGHRGERDGGDCEEALHAHDSARRAGRFDPNRPRPPDEAGSWRFPRPSC